MSSIDLDFFVEGQPYAKQSFRFTRSGGSYQTQNVKQWQRTIRIIARDNYSLPPVTGDCCVELCFYLRRNIADVDNLAKAVLDGLQGVVFKNDRKVISLLSQKCVSKTKQGVRIRIHGNVK